MGAKENIRIDILIVILNTMKDLRFIIDRLA